MTESKWLKFILAEKQNPKTKIWNVRSKDDSCLLGIVKWYGPWRKYSFFPNQNLSLVFEETCLTDIATFIKEETKLHKQK
jgi:hypothetical protein